MDINKNRLGYFFEIALFLVILFVVIIPPPSYSDLTRCRGGCWVRCPRSISDIFFNIKGYYDSKLTAFNSNKSKYLWGLINETLTFF